MPNKFVLADAEGVPSSHQVSLSAAIFRYRSDWNAFLAASLEEPKSGEDLADMFKPSMKVIEKWSRPAESQQEAALALQLALEDYEMGDTPRIPAMIKAALGFLDRDQGVADRAACAEAVSKTIPALFAQWKALYDVASNMSYPDIVAEKAFDSAVQIEKMIVPILPETAQEFAMKLLVVTSNGDFQPGDSLIAEAVALTAGLKEGSDV
ncbi:hypothetical protein [Pararhizobium sp. DWP3-4]|uniref:hypothetical protein n=1 Tax=Pararhizobium sp. DWP3-4 TaxID=2804565 RepID=UPI003CF234E1